MEMEVSVRAVYVDYYLSPTQERSSPVVRVFGSTPHGQRCCLHLHGAFPYFFIPCPPTLLPRELVEDVAEGNRLLVELGRHIEAGMLAEQQQQQQQQGGKRSGGVVPGGARGVVARLSFAKGTPFFGFHRGLELFIKVQVYDPFMVPRVATLLGSEKTGFRGYALQAHESHIGYLMQVMLDHGISGMEYVHVVGKFTFRGPLPVNEDPEENNLQKNSFWFVSNTPANMVVTGTWKFDDDQDLFKWYASSVFPARQTTCELEIDADISTVNPNREQSSPNPKFSVKYIKSLLPWWEEHLQAGGKFRDETVLTHEQTISENPSLVESEYWRRLETIRDRVHKIRSSGTSSNENGDEEQFSLPSSQVSQDDLVPDKNETTFNKLNSDVDVDDDDSEIASILHGLKGSATSSEKLPENTDRDGDAISRSSTISSVDPEETEAQKPEEWRLILESQLEEEHQPGTDKQNENGDDSRKPETPPQKSPPPESSATVSTPHRIGKFEPIEGGMYQAREGPPLGEDLLLTLPKFNLPSITYQEPFFSRPDDVPAHTSSGLSRNAADHNFHRPIYEPGHYKFPPLNNSESVSEFARQANKWFQPVAFPPSYKDAQQWIRERKRKRDFHNGDESVKKRDTKIEPSSTRQHELDSYGRMVTVITPPRLKDQSLTNDAPTSSSQSQDSASDEDEGLVTLSTVSIRENRPLQEAPRVPKATPAKRIESTPPVFATPITRSPLSGGFLATSQISYPTSSKKSQGTRSGYRHSSTLSSKENQNLIILSLEIHAGAPSQHQGPPDPSFHPVEAIAYCIRNDIADAFIGIASGGEQNLESSRGKGDIVGIIIVDPEFGQVIFDPEKQSATFDDKATTTATTGPRAKPCHPATPLLFSASELNLIPPFPNHARIGVAGANHPDNYVHSDFSKELVVRVVKTEVDLILTLVALVREVDPDFFVGWELQRLSLGYLLDRANNLGIPLARALSRSIWGPQNRQHGNDEWGSKNHSGFWISGRNVLNSWRVIREEVKLSMYSLESTMFSVLGVRLPFYSYGTLNFWWQANQTLNKQRHPFRWRVLRQLTRRATATLHILDHLDIFGRTSELARLLGIDFFSVLTRGSQFRVEAVMMRIVKTLNFIVPSPSRKQVMSQPAMESVPLILEPMSRLYSNPVCVFDFRSLYPSVMIAHNLCFTTCLGRLRPRQVASTDKEETIKGIIDSEFLPGLGFDRSFRPDVEELLKTGQSEKLFVSPTGSVFVSREVREGILPRMLREILDTRVMVKSGMKMADEKKDQVLKRILDARQFGLKMVANVTYGYTAASFSGRAPCAELADTIVATGRDALERAINMVKTCPEWQPVEVVYGDTDSLFVHLPGRTLEQAFALGREISSRITSCHPSPMKLQFEKVYMPCVLQVKKRYCGMKYESEHQVKEGIAHLEAKGIETVRRDGFPALTKIMDSSLRILFLKKDLSLVKQYVQDQFTKMIAGRVPVDDFIISGKVKLGQYASDRTGKGHPPPAAVAAKKIISLFGPRAGPLYKERWPYVIICGVPGSRLVDLVASPHDVVLNPSDCRLNTKYYISKKIIPALERIFNIVGVDVSLWFTQLPRRPMERSWFAIEDSTTQQRTIEHFLDSKRCFYCREVYKNDNSSHSALCESCRSDPQRAEFVKEKLQLPLMKRFQRVIQICKLCQGCSGGVLCDIEAPFTAALSTKVKKGTSHLTVETFEQVECSSLDCSIYFYRKKVTSEWEHIANVLVLHPPENILLS